MERWQGKVALVTGCSSGIGADVASTLTKLGMKVVAIARRADKIEELASTLKSTSISGEIYPRKADVSKEEDVIALFQWIKEKFGTIHLLINNAGVNRYGMFCEQPSQYWRDIFDINVLGLLYCTQQAIKLMRDSQVDDGQIIHINSVLGHIVPNLPMPFLSVYPASKFAVTALTETIRQELNFLKTKIRVCSISPGQVATEFAHAATEAMGVKLPTLPPEMLNAPRLESKDVTQAVVYVLSTGPNVQVHELTLRPVGSIA